MQSCTVAAVAICFSLSASCGDDLAGPDNALEPNRPTRVGALTLDTTVEQVELAVAGSPSGTTLVGILADARGRRALELRLGGATLVVAAADWNLPATAAWADGTALICWNRLSETEAGEPAPPSEGLPVLCRYLVGGG